MGRAAGICGGRGGSQHICDSNVFSNGVQGGIVPISAGIAMAQKLSGDGNIAVVFIGDGTLGEGVLYESLNLCSLWKLPLLIVLENNSYAQSTPQRQTMAGSVRARAEAFGILTDGADTWNVPNLLGKLAEAAARVRTHCEPLFFEVETYRLMAHSKGDDDRDPIEVSSFWKRDPLVLFEEKFPEEVDAFRAEFKKELDAIVTECEASAFAGRTSEVSVESAVVRWRKAEIKEEDRVVNRIYAGLRSSMEKDDRIMILGEDVEGPYGGAFKVTKDLNMLFPGRVRNTPISESAILGIGNGLALRDLRPVCEFMFGDFVLLAADQFVNHAAKFKYMYNDQVRVPVAIRTPMGGKRGYGATHSQSLEKHLLGVPDTRVLALHHRYDPCRVYETLLSTIDRPTLIVENKTLYGEKVSAACPKGYEWQHSDHLFPLSYLKSSDRADLTFLCYGGMLPEVEKAVETLFYENDLIAEIICPLQIFPLQMDSILEKIGTDRVVVVEEGQGFCGLGAEMAAQLQEGAREKRRMVHRIAAAEQAIPSCRPLEIELLPTASSIVNKTLEYLR
jgi:2-oxoisovalerate dehydrogenase E1 component